MMRVEITDSNGTTRTYETLSFTVEQNDENPFEDESVLHDNPLPWTHIVLTNMDVVKSNGNT